MDVGCSTGSEDHLDDFDDDKVYIPAHLAEGFPVPVATHEVVNNQQETKTVETADVAGVQAIAAVVVKDGKQETPQERP